jgi:uracil-DNA glycosylase
LPHPSWRNTAWLNRNPWFATEALPALRTTLKESLADDRP